MRGKIKKIGEIVWKSEGVKVREKRDSVEHWENGKEREMRSLGDVGAWDEGQKASLLLVKEKYR